MHGRRRKDGTPAHDLMPGDYAKGQVSVGGDSIEVWWFCTPNGMAGRLSTPHDGPRHHEIVEHVDGTISVLPSPTNSNSIKSEDGRGRIWHGYIRCGVWEPLEDTTG